MATKRTLEGRTHSRDQDGVATEPDDSAPAGPGAELVDRSGRGRTSLRSVSVDADAAAGLARVTLRQTFVNEASEPLQATYRFPLPHEAAVGGYAFTIDGKRVVGEIDRRQTARERFDDAVLNGHTAGLLEQERTTVFTQELGNIPPGATVECEITFDQKLRWLADGQWEWRFPTVIGPRYIGDANRVPDHRRIEVPTRQPGAPRLDRRGDLQLMIRDDVSVAHVSSPSHPIAARETSQDAHSQIAVALARAEGVALDRDIIVRWTAAGPQVNLQVDVARPAPLSHHPLADHERQSDGGGPAFGLVTLVPPLAGAPVAALPRDLILLIDTSGSMSGEPLAKAKAIAAAMIESLTTNDRLEMIEFSMQPHRWEPEPVRMTVAARGAALQWLQRLRAGGGTEMELALLEALATLRDDAKRQVVLISDGYVGFEESLVRNVRRRTPAECSVHSIGIGSAANRSLTAAVARAGRGEEHLIGIDEPVAEAVERVLKRLSAPLVMDVRLAGSAVIDTARELIPDVPAGSPTQIPVRLRPEGGTLVVHGRGSTGAWQMTWPIAAIPENSGSASIARLYARERVDDLEQSCTAADVERDAQIEHIGLTFGILTRLTSWIAISEHATVDPSDPIRREMVEQDVAYALGPDTDKASAAMWAPQLIRTTHACLRAQSSAFDDATEPWDDEVRVDACASAAMSYRPLRGFQAPDDAAVPSKSSSDAVDRLTRADVVMFKHGQIGLELVVDARLQWDPERVTIEPAGGEHVVEVVHFGPMRPATVHPGSRIRLLLLFAPPDVDASIFRTCRIRITMKPLRKQEPLVHELQIFDPHGLLTNRA